MARVVKQQKATADLDAIYDYIALENLNPSAADRWIDELHQRMETYARQPLMGELREDLGPDLRCFSFGKNYVVIYLPVPDGIDVLRVFHTARDYPRLFHDDR